MTRGRRDANERAIIEALEAVGCSVLQLGDREREGIPDLLVGVLRVMRWPYFYESAENILLEIKSPKGKLREGQEEWARNWNGAEPVVVRTPEEALEACGFEATSIPPESRRVAQAGR